MRIKGSLICSRPEAESMLKTVAKHKISVKTDPFLGLREAPKLIDLAQSGKMRGRAVVIIDEETKRVLGREDDFILVKRYDDHFRRAEIEGMK